MGSRPSDSRFRMEEIHVSRLNSDVDIYIDAVFVGKEATTDDIGIVHFSSVFAYSCNIIKLLNEFKHVLKMYFLPSILVPSISSTNLPSSEALSDL